MSVSGLYRADFRLRSFLATQLEAIVSTSTTPIFKHTLTVKAAEQLALCYKIGFGVPKTEGDERGVSAKSSQSGVIEEQVQLIKDSLPGPRHMGDLFHQLHHQGFIQFIDFPQYYREKRLVSEAIKIYRREIQDTKEIFGEDHWLNVFLRSQFACILTDQGQWKEAEGLEVQLIETSKRMF